MIKGTSKQRHVHLDAHTYRTPTARINSICFALLWICAPILVSISVFFVYVASGNELTIGTAFTVRPRAGCMRPS